MESGISLPSSHTDSYLVDITNTDQANLENLSLSIHNSRNKIKNATKSKISNYVNDFVDGVEWVSRMIIDSVDPFYRLRDEKTFKNEFSLLFSKFKNKKDDYLEEPLVCSCGVLQDQLAKIKEDKNISNQFPILSKELEKLDSDLWLLRNYHVTDILSNIYDEFSKRLSSIYRMLDLQTVEESQQELRSFLNEVDDKIEKLNLLRGKLQKVKFELFGRNTDEDLWFGRSTKEL